MTQAAYLSPLGNDCKQTWATAMIQERYFFITEQFDAVQVDSV